MIFARVPPAGRQPMIILNLWYAGTELEAKKAFNNSFRTRSGDEYVCSYAIQQDQCWERRCMYQGRTETVLLGWFGEIRCCKDDKDLESLGKLHS